MNTPPSLLPMNSFPQNTAPEVQTTSPKKSGGVMARAGKYFGGALAAVAGLVAVENSAEAQTKLVFPATGNIIASGVIDTNCCGGATSAPVQAPPVVITVPSTTATARGGASTVVQQPIVVTTISAPTNAPASSASPIPINTAQVVYSAQACATTMVTRASSPVVKPACQPTLSIEQGAASLISTTYIPTSAGTIVDINGARVGGFSGAATGANDVEQLRRLAGVREENVVRKVLSEQSIWRAIRAPLPGVAVNQTFIRETVYKTCAGKETMSRTTMEPACEKGPWCGGSCKGKH